MIQEFLHRAFTFSYYQISLSLNEIWENSMDYLRAQTRAQFQTHQTKTLVLINQGPSRYYRMNTPQIQREWEPIKTEGQE